MGGCLHVDRPPTCAFMVMVGSMLLLRAGYVMCLLAWACTCPGWDAMILLGNQRHLAQHSLAPLIVDFLGLGDQQIPQ
jgi:hypothetical protein